MPSATDRLDFAPPQQPGMLRAFALAIVAHLLLLLALTWGVNWKRDSENLAAEAELWSSTVQQAAPRPVETAPPPPAPIAAPVAKVAPPPRLESVQRDADIALEREKKKRVEAKEREEDLERQKKQELARKADDKKKAETRKAQEARQQQEEVKRLEALRQDNLRRMQGLAGATGAPGATGTAQRSSGPSPNYAGRIAARIKPNIVFSETVAGNPSTEVRIRVAPDGTIVGKTLVRSSGYKAWDDAVMRAIDKTGEIPRDTDGRVVPEFPISFRPND